MYNKFFSQHKQDFIIIHKDNICENDVCVCVLSPFIRIMKGILFMVGL